MMSAACELIWLKGLLSDLEFSSNIPLPMFCDNQVAMHITTNYVFQRRGDRPPHSIVGVSGKYGETRSSCLFISGKNRMGVAT
jgi:hypothetical protein